MILSLVDSLRCPREHEPASLVLSVEAWSGTRITHGVLGCPLCHGRFRIDDGVVDFSEGASPQARRQERSSAEDPMRLAAQLGLSESGGIILLAGDYGLLVDSLLEVIEFTPILTDFVADRAVTFRMLDRIPFADGALIAAAVDSSRATTTFLAQLARCIRPGGRLVAPAEATLPEGMRLLARDGREWVAEVPASTPVIALRRGAR